MDKKVAERLQKRFRTVTYGTLAGAKKLFSSTTRAATARSTRAARGPHPQGPQDLEGRREDGDIKALVDSLDGDETGELSIDEIADFIDRGYAAIVDPASRTLAKTKPPPRRRRRAARRCSRSSCSACSSRATTRRPRPPRPRPPRPPRTARRRARRRRRRARGAAAAPPRQAPLAAATEAIIAKRRPRPRAREREGRRARAGNLAKLADELYRSTRRGGRRRRRRQRRGEPATRRAARPNRRSARRRRRRTRCRSSR